MGKTKASSVGKKQVVGTSKLSAQVAEGKAFVLKDGRQLRTIYELIDELETMNDDSFHQFVNERKNDFASWVEGVFGDKTLAAELKGLDSRVDSQRAILKHVVRVLQ